MEELFQRQEIIAESIKKIVTNLKKDSVDRKTVDYAKTRLDSLNKLWREFEENHIQLQTHENKTDDYFTTNAFEKVKRQYDTTRAMLHSIISGASQQSTVPRTGASEEKGIMSKSDELIKQQGTNFRAFMRVIKNIKLNDIYEKWELQDKLQMLQQRWKVIDDVHWQIDNLLIGSDVDYEQDFAKHESIYEATKRELNQKLLASSHQHQSLPQIEIPAFSGNYSQWPTFMDLYSEAIHNNPTLTKTQKMQHLKGKLKGEPERLVQHLNISAENYDTCWELLTHRYNNIQLLFTKQIQIFMNQPSIHKHCSNELKRLHDVSLETIHGIHNLGVDTTTWDPILVHILTEKMDPDTYASYMETRKAPRSLPVFDELIGFLESKFTALEPLTKRNKPISTGKTEQTQNKEFSAKFLPTRNNFKNFSPKTFHASTERSCPICKSDHLLVYCKEFQNMPPETKLRSISQHKICQNCMYCHNGKQCNSSKRCRVCNKPHHTTLHDIIIQSNSVEILMPVNMTPTTSRYASPPAPVTTPRKSNHVAGNYEVLLATMEIKVKAADGTLMRMRALLDQGSQINLITESAAQRLGLPRCHNNSTVSGVGISDNKSKGMVQLECGSVYDGYTFTTEALVMPKLLNNLPNYTFEKQDWPHLHNINLADSSYNISRSVDILLDAGVYARIVMDGILRGPSQAPIAQQTKLGWVLLGNFQTFNCHAVLNNIEEISQFWEIEEISEKISLTLTPEEEYCERLYQNTTKRNSEGRYEVRIPMKPDFENYLGPSKPQAVAQFRQIEKRLAKDSDLAENYKKFMNEYLELQHMKECTSPREPSYFLPHHGVMKLDSTTTKLRVVFNGSHKTKSGYSLNELMECGPNLQQDLQSMILRWRRFQYVYTADIEKFYRQILVQEIDQHLTKIVWRNTIDDVIREYQLCTVTYGTKAAPYLAMRTIKQLIRDEGHRFPLAANTLDNQLYVDDLLGGSNDILEAKETQKQLINILKTAGFNLRKWASNDSRLLEELSHALISQNMIDFKHAETNKTLGITWNPRTDQFTFKQTIPITTNNEDNDIITKRTLLSDLSKIYDPMGWLSPVTMKAKIILQHVWTLTTGWDDPLPQNIQKEWHTFKQDLLCIKDITITRWMGNTNQPFELHGFCDASEKAYACVIYCKSLNENGDHMIRLVGGKTKLAPLNKTITLPRLELCGALLLSRLLKKVIESQRDQTVQIKIHGWTDSMVVLGWIQGDVSRWKAFVANRVKTITSNMPLGCWKHVKSEDNAADCASRGQLPSQLSTNKLWWEGPSWLKKKDIPVQEQQFEVPNEEMKKQVCAAQTFSYPLIEELLNNHSSMARLVRVLGWVSRFIQRARCDANASLTTYLTKSELESAHHIIVKSVQYNYFTGEIGKLQKGLKISSNSQILNLDPFLDSEGILRVGGRLQQADLTISQKHPIILPHNDKLTSLLMEQAHKRTLHGGTRITLAYLRDKYWILKGVRTVKGFIQKCVRCHRFKTTKNTQVMAELPKPRVTPSRPFTHTGVDFTGQVEVKANKGRGIKTTKAYIAIFICLVTKAVHLELVSDMTTSSFLAALKRLCSRRGCPQHIYSDNGTNFVGAAKILMQEYKEAMQQYINIELIESAAEMGIIWHFNAPGWPTAGGLWEAAVKSMKHHLRRVLGEQKLTFEEFTTLITQIEACLNSRHLVALTDDVEDLDCLTPGHFLVGGPVLSSPLSPELEQRSIRTRWHLTEKNYRDFWKRWSSEYLQTLQTRGKWQQPTRNIETGDIVLIKEENIPPARWLLARVTETHPGTDGRVRVVTLKTKNGFAKRPITKLSRLPLEQQTNNEMKSETTPSKSSSEETPRTRRANNRKKFNNYFCTFFWLLVMCISPSVQQQLVNVTELSPTKLIYFDKIADLQIIQDEWKMVVYYNISTYWQSLKNIENYINHLNSLCKDETAFLTISAQFQHELNELKHYNEIMLSEHGTRYKRGLINGIGYVANSLFGVLDERFAEKHLLTLYKKHTSIIEGEYNLLKRNEQVMNKQFHIINKHLKQTEERIQIDRNNANYIIATALAANLVISNLRRVQQSLLDLVTDVRNGRVDTHLLKPDQFQEQLNVISGQLPSGLSLPCVNNHHCIREMYHLSRVHLRLTIDFLIFEVKLPLINNEPYELNKIIPIPHIEENKIRTISATTTYLAVNLKRDQIITLDYEDIATCMHLNTYQMLCHINAPTYDIKVTATMCEAQIINNRNLSACRSVVSDCRDHWIQLHNGGAWLFTCCKHRSARVFCPAGMTSQTLHGTGIIELAPGCMLKGENIIIHSHNKFQSEVTMTDDEMPGIQESAVNHILNSIEHSVVPEDHEETLKILKDQIETVKVQQNTLNLESSVHSTHYYTTYALLAIIILAAIGTCLVAKCRNKFGFVLNCSRNQQNNKPEFDRHTTRSLEDGIGNYSEVPATAPQPQPQPPPPLPQPNIRSKIDKATSPSRDQ